MDTALYIKYKGRGWAVWISEKNELIGIPEDEKPFDQDDLLSLEQYLFDEGFFSEYYNSRTAWSDGTY